MRINGNKPKGKNTMKGEKKRKKMQVAPPGFELHPNFLVHATIAQFEP